jgi:iron complex outermembrane receptor protein
MPVNGIARLEVIRGPGSALFGADAFAGIINIVTKGIEDLDGTEVGGRVGQYNTKDVWMLHGGKWAGNEVATSIEYHTTDGPNRNIEADSQISPWEMEPPTKHVGYSSRRLSFAMALPSGLSRTL